MNFSAFCLHDNDFHYALSRAIPFVMENATEELTPTSLHQLVVTATSLFSTLSRIDNFAASRVPTNHWEYLTSKLRFQQVNNISELRNFDGYVLDMHTGAMFYYSDEV